MEANSFSPALADRGTFKRGVWAYGKEMEHLRSKTIGIGGVYKYFDDMKDVEIVPGFSTWAMSSGPIKTGEFEYLADMLFKSLEDAGKIDGVMLTLHGACQSESVEDCEGYILDHIRAIVGEHVPIVSSFDLHACMTEKMMSCLDGANGYYTFPHLDIEETSYRAARSLYMLLHKRIQPAKLLKTIPFVPPCDDSTNTDKPLFGYAMKMMKEALDLQGVLSGALFTTQPWLDTPELGTELCLFFEDEASRVEFEIVADSILNYLWDRRNVFYSPMPEMDEAIKWCTDKESTICLVDYGDVLGGGAVGDSTVALRSLLKEKPDMTSCLTIVDPECVQKAREIGLGGKYVFEIGSSNEEGYNKKIPVEAEVIMINTEPFVNLGPFMKNRLVDPGTRVLLRSGGINIILLEFSCPPQDRNMLITMGIDPASIGIVIHKQTQSFKSCYDGIMKTYLYVNTPGCTDRDLKRLPFKKIKRPLFPIDNI